MWRGPGGVLHVRGDDPACRAFGLGWGHALDRGLQMAVIRIVGRGEAAWRLGSDDRLVQQDRYLRRRRIRAGARRDTEGLDADELAIAEAYCAGVNAWLARPCKRPLFWLLGLQEEPWTPEDVLLVLRTMAWTSLAQPQELVERFIVRATLGGTDHDLATLRAVFSPDLDDLDPELIRGGGGAPPVTLAPSAVELDPLCARCLPMFGGSNAWALTGDRTASGRPMVANDPHLDMRNLPPAFYEVASAGPDGSSIGLSIPGIPGVLAGRFTHVAVGVTYAMLDQVDFFVEECRQGKVRRADAWVDAEHHTEQIRLKGSDETLPLDIWESDRGVIEGDPREPGRYLCRAWAADHASLAPVLRLPGALEQAADLHEAMEAAAGASLPFNFVIADEAGAIGMQQAGLVPDRPGGWTGLSPRPAWDPATAWRGVLPPEALARTVGSTTGYLATANEAVNPTGGPRVSNSALPDHRVRRLRELLAPLRSARREDMVAIQRDLTSLRARHWLAELGHLLPDTAQGRELAAWDCVYRPKSTAPTLFERLCGSWMLAAYGGLFDRADPCSDEPGPAVTEGLELPADAARLWLESNAIAVQGAGFDRELLDPASPLWAGRDRDGLLRRAAEQALSATARPFRLAHRARRTWFLLEGSWLSRLGLTSRMIAVPGAQATPHQGRIIRLMGQVFTLAPVWRMVADLGRAEVETALAGGPSDRPLSPLHRADLAMFGRFGFKTLGPPE